MKNHTTKQAAVSIRLDDGRIIGRVVGDVFCKNVIASKHFLRTPPAIAFDIQSLMDARAAGAVFVAVTDTESGRVYRAPLHTITQAGFVFNRGHGSQVALPIARWTVAGDASGAQLQFPF